MWSETVGAPTPAASAAARAQIASNNTSVAVPPFMRLEPATASGPITGFTNRPVSSTAAATSRSDVPFRRPSTGAFLANVAGLKPTKIAGQPRCRA